VLLWEEVEILLVLCVCHFNVFYERVPFNTSVLQLWAILTQLTQVMFGIACTDALVSNMHTVHCMQISCMNRIPEESSIQQYMLHGILHATMHVQFDLSFPV